MSAKYTTIEELAEAFRSGELDDTYYLHLDKGGCDLTLRRKPPEGDIWTEEEYDEEYDRCQELFKWDYDNCIQTLFTMVGINSEWC